MAELLSTASVTTTTAAVTLFSLCPGVDASIVIGAFAGAMLFVLVARDLSWPKRLAFFVISLVNGGLAARMMAALLSSLLPASIHVSLSVGALVAAAISVSLLRGLIRCAGHLDRHLASLHSDQGRPR